MWWINYKLSPHSKSQHSLFLIAYNKNYKIEKWSFSKHYDGDDGLNIEPSNSKVELSITNCKWCTWHNIL